jgi:MFS family permease
MAEAAAPNQFPGDRPWWKELTRYHWLVVVIASCGWLFDCMDQRIFALAREPALREVLGSGVADPVLKSWGGWATGVMMISWATGGIIFGIMSDRWGRVKTMAVTLLIYSGFTGLSGFRPLALGLLQTVSASGNIIGSLLSTRIQPGRADFMFGMAGWRIMFFVGILPAILVVPIILVLREPERWKQAKRKAAAGADQAKRFGSIPDLFRHPVWRRNLLVGVCLGLAGMAGLWGIGFFSPELISTALKGQPQGVIDMVRGYGTALQDVGSFLGMMTFTLVATFLGRRPAFGGAFILCLVTTIFVFNNLRSGADAYWMLPMMGFAQLSVFGGYSIYFPELFPTRLRGTGVGFCYNTVRYLAAGFPPMLMFVNQQLLAANVNEPFRKAATMLSFIFVLGLVALIWAPETKGQPLPED